MARHDVRICHDDYCLAECEDDEGVELSDFAAAKELAALSLAELAKDVLPGSIKRVLAVEVRDVARPILRDVLTFEAVTLAD